MKKLKKILFVLVCKFIKLINYFNVSMYMKLYTKLLISAGIKMPTYKGVGYIDPSAQIDGSDYKLIKLGKNVTISKNVILLTHDFSIWHGMMYKDERVSEKRYKFLKEIQIGNNVFVGANSLILPGTMIGDNVIIGGGCVVKGMISKNTVWAGNPARRICSMEEFVDKHIEIEDYMEIYNK